jgi:hypothetical protein
METQIQNRFAMRTLSPEEITLIDQRLESLKIQYLEIYHELRDHYFTELEKKSAEDFEATFQQLNETFAWSVVKKMEKELRKATTKQIGSLQLKALRFWELSGAELSIALLILGSLVCSFFFLDLPAFFSATGIIAISGSIVMWALLGWRKSFNFSLNRQKPIGSFSAAILIRLSPVYGFFGYTPLGIRLSGGNSEDLIYSILFIGLGLVMTIFLLTIVKISFDKKLKTA